MAGDITGATEALVAGSFYDNPVTSSFVYKAKEFDLSGATVEQTDGLTITIVMTESQRATAIQVSSTPGGDIYNVNPTYLSIGDGALNDMANNNVIVVTEGGAAGGLCLAAVGAAGGVVLVGDTVGLLSFT